MYPILYFSKKKCIEAICLQGSWGSTLYSLSHLREKKKKTSPWHQRPDNRFGKTELYSKVEILLKINNNQTRYQLVRKDASYKHPKAPGRCLRAGGQPWLYQVHVMSNTCIINRQSLDQLWEIRDSATKEIWVRWHPLRQSGFYVMHFLIPRTFNLNFITNIENILLLAFKMWYFMYGRLCHHIR